jgi:hypothetical protein
MCDEVHWVEVWRNFAEESLYLKADGLMLVRINTKSKDDSS